ncbi:uncharacterized protein EAF02_000047 [Botrytis sinoallii]|uniref:uncharacterized protein n=1 Tax=Botrytis sinoallii TaxID=1463999 RepID=UPI00190040C5|nr:uncharacterized protein EAF02_000047 [Botrytis sinoallii]KAF7892509.1 hypothetical protein EAF02_000047 [Botrytis sinoallii]
MPESTSITPALDPTYIRRSPRCLLMLYNQFNVIADVLQARQEVIVEALEIMAEKQNRKNYREWSLKWRDYLMATFEEADESENNLKELLESWDEEKVAQAYMEASGKSDKVRNEKTGKCKRAEDGAEEEEQEDGRRAEGEEQEDERRAEEEEQEEAGEGNKKRMGRRSRRKIIIEDESEDLEEDEAGVDLEGSILLE